MKNNSKEIAQEVRKKVILRRIGCVLKELNQLLTIGMPDGEKWCFLSMESCARIVRKKDKITVELEKGGSIKIEDPPATLWLEEVAFSSSEEFKKIQKNVGKIS